VQVLALDFPPISHLLEWPDIWLKGNKYFAVTRSKADVDRQDRCLGFYLAAARKASSPRACRTRPRRPRLHPRGVILQTMGPGAA
jgi:hypothetical protein